VVERSTLFNVLDGLRTVLLDEGGTLLSQGPSFLERIHKFELFLFRHHGELIFSGPVSLGEGNVVGLNLVLSSEGRGSNSEGGKGSESHL
jgi:hypothetical protein